MGVVLSLFTRLKCYSMSNSENIIIHREGQ